MKTKELIENLRDYAEVFDQNEGVIMGMHWTVDKKIQRLRIFGLTPRVVANWLGEYTATPIEEREEPKKYYLKPKGIKLLWGKVMNYNYNSNSWHMASKLEDILWKTQFTLEELKELGIPIEHYDLEEVKEK